VLQHPGQLELLSTLLCFGRLYAHLFTLNPLLSFQYMLNTTRPAEHNACSSTTPHAMYGPPRIPTLCIGCNATPARTFPFGLVPAASFAPKHCFFRTPQNCFFHCPMPFYNTLHYSATFLAPTVAHPLCPGLLVGSLYAHDNTY